jgi:hypothetical protein
MYFKIKRGKGNCYKILKESVPALAFFISKFVFDIHNEIFHYEEVAISSNFSSVFGRKGMKPFLISN